MNQYAVIYSESDLSPRRYTTLFADNQFEAEEQAKFLTCASIRIVKPLDECIDELNAGGYELVSFEQGPVNIG